VVDTIEAGFKGQFDRVRANVSVYKSQAEGTYFFIFLAANSTQNLGSLNEVEYQGFEVDLTATLNEYFDANLGFGLTDSEITDSDTPSDIGNRAPNVSDYTFNLGLNGSRPLQQYDGVELFGRVDYQIIGETAFFDREQADTNDRDPVHLTDLRVGLQAPGNWTLTLWSKNLFDEEYNAEYSTGGFVFKGMPRQWGIDFMQRF
jgi:iron complex outermembrane receptor protein